MFEKLKKQSKRGYTFKINERNARITLKILGKSWNLSSREQNDSFPKNLIIANEKITDKKAICVVPQGLILGPLLFIIYVKNNLCQTSEFLKPIMFADDANLLCKSKTIKALFWKQMSSLKKLWNGFKQRNYL